jgi:hypothetical protein
MVDSSKLLISNVVTNEVGWLSDIRAGMTKDSTLSVWHTLKGSTVLLGQDLLLWETVVDELNSKYSGAFNYLSNYYVINHIKWRDPYLTIGMSSEQFRSLPTLHYIVSGGAVRLRSRYFSTIKDSDIVMGRRLETHYKGSFSVRKYLDKIYNTRNVP